MTKMKTALFIVVASLFLSTAICGPFILWSNYTLNKENERRNHDLEMMIISAERELQLTYTAYKREETLAIEALKTAVEKLEEAQKEKRNDYTTREFID